ncbi:unnamed protein product [Vitrella brassicaformis CCMP3155]|uniref:RRM domain-containing protein n=1 Tax=Vitrella brassicaformis (strain CCMP3155) TaxID=1169540 RepID=A0A0G4FRW5_VITBC|nr:unnamed protein product [Vitrella brassicaformis CCMP3155]|eukprot:CEM16845.1 unnamed protein product [Vitrella brassicaformis CCMP3155]
MDASTAVNRPYDPSASMAAAPTTTTGPAVRRHPGRASGRVWSQSAARPCALLIRNLPRGVNEQELGLAFSPLSMQAH